MEAAHSTVAPCPQFSAQHLDSVGPPRGRFGFAVTSLGDLDGDDFDDVAIAAPATNRIYVFRGFSGGLVLDAYQVCPALHHSPARLSLTCLPTGDCGLWS